jgi:protein-disulfide isomerase
MLKDLEEIRTFLKAATNGRFGSPSVENTPLDLTNAPARGSASAPVTLVEISDYHCPFCRRHIQQTAPQIYSDYIQTGKVRHVFIHYPIDQLHPDAYKSHEAAMCAADQGKFWELHAKLFETQATTPEQLIGMAQSAGLDVAAFRTCLTSKKHAAEVRQSVEKMSQLGLTGTPMFLIGRTPKGSEPFKNLQSVQGAQSFSVFKQAFDDALAKPR